MIKSTWKVDQNGIRTCIFGLPPTGPLLHQLSYRVSWEQYASFIQFKGTSSRIGSVKSSRESLVHFNVVSNIKSCGISPSFHCLAHVPKICSRHIFYKAFVPNASFHHLSHLVFLVVIYVTARISSMSHFPQALHLKCFVSLSCMCSNTLF